MPLYRNCYRELHRRVQNIVCTSCACINHEPASFGIVPSDYPPLSLPVMGFGQSEPEANRWLDRYFELIGRARLPRALPGCFEGVLTARAA